ncbi:MAG TPA: hypothetical protein VKE40_23325 [Gemmataceae bacterium]|nr:hypothetical protein [Gemmataceae bacterium]
MPIAISCPHCDWKGKVKDALAGKTGKCPTCGEMVPIPKPARSGPPPIPGKKSAAVDSDPDVVDDADIVDDAETVEDRPKPRVKPKSASMNEALSSINRGRRDDDEDDRPRRKRPDDDDDDDDRPAKARRRVADDDDGDRPSKARRRLADDDDDDEPRSRRRKLSTDDDDDEPPRRKKRRRTKPPQSINAKRAGAVIGGIILLLAGLALFAFVFFARGRISIYAAIIVVLSIVGIFQGFTGIGLSDGDDGGDDD